MGVVDARQTDEWGDFLSRIGWKVEKVQGINIFIKKIPYFPYSVVKIQRPKNPLPFKEFDEIAKKYKSLFIVLEPHFEKLNTDELKRNGYQKSHLIFSHTATLHLDLTNSEKKIWNNFSENGKRNIKKAQRNNLKIKVIEMKKEKDDRYFKIFFELLLNLTNKKNIYNPGYDEYWKKMQSFKKTSTLFFAYFNNEPVSVLWTAGYKNDFVIYVQTGVTDIGYKLLANYLLVWESIKYLKNKGIKTYDFEGIYDPRFPKERVRWKNFTEFKKRFHGKLVEYPPSYIKIYNPLFKILFFISKFLPGV